MYIHLKMWFVIVGIALVLPAIGIHPFSVDGDGGVLTIEYSLLSDVGLVFEGVDGGLVLYSLEAPEASTVVVEVSKLPNDVHNLTIRIIGLGLGKDLWFSLLLYKNHIYIGDELLGFSPFYFDIPVTFDYLLDEVSRLEYLGYAVAYPDKPVKMVGYMGFEAIPLQVKEGLAVSHLGVDDLGFNTASKLAFYKAEVRGRLALKVDVLLPANVLPYESYSMLVSHVSGVLGMDLPPLRYLSLSMGISNEYVSRYRDFILGQPVCIERCASTQLSMEGVLFLILLAAIVALVVMVRRVGL